MSDGWVKLHRSTLENPVVCKDAEHIAVWVYLLLKATHKEKEMIFSGEKITLKPGQLITGRKKISEYCKVNESKVQRILKSFENEHQIEQQTANKNRLITVVNWDKYQSSEQQFEQQVNNNRTTTEQQLNTNKKERNKECKKDIDNIVEKESRQDTIKEIIDYLNLKTKKNFKAGTKATQRHISARLEEGYSLEDFKCVIDKKVREWSGTEMDQYLRPETLFGTKFEGYLNQSDKPVSKPTQQKSKNKFHNFEQRSYDYGALEQACFNKVNGIPTDAGIGGVR